MLFDEKDAPHLKTWIISRLSHTSDADADVLADYVLALLRHEGDIETVRGQFDREITDFLKGDAAAFTRDVFQAVRYRSYLPDAPPAPLSPPVNSITKKSAGVYSTRYEAPPPQLLSYGPPPAAPFSSQNGSRKRTYNDRDDDDVDIILTSRDSNGGPPSFKQQRRGGGYNQRGGRPDDPFGGRSQRGYGQYQPPLPPPQATNRWAGPPSFPPYPPVQGLPIDANAIMENIQRLEQMGIPRPQMNDLPGAAYSGYAPSPPMRRRKAQCRDYVLRGFCPRGNHCMYEHGVEPMSYIPPSEEYDPANARLILPVTRHNPTPTPTQPLDINPLPAMSPSTRRESKKTRRNRGRPDFATSHPMHDRSKKILVVQNVPPENYTEDHIRGYFSQFGNIEEVSMKPQDRIALIKFDSWEAANAAWSSPKVIFDNRFVKLFWFKEEAEDGASSGAKSRNGHANGNGSIGEVDDVEPDFDHEEFKRKQEEAQKIYEEKKKKREDIERARQDLEKREKALRAEQAEARRKLREKLAANGLKDGSSSPAEIKTGGPGNKGSAQTESLKAQLAALEQEATQLGIDPHTSQEDYASWTPRGRGRGRGYRGRGGFPPTASRGGFSYRGRGGGLEARHAAYAAYSLDLRPKIVALSGIDFTASGRGEALRQHLFSVGEFKDIHIGPTTTHVSFKDRKAAEQFMFGVSANNSIPGVEGKVEASWTTSAPESGPSTAADGDAFMVSGLEDEQSGRDKATIGGNGATGELEEGEVGSAHDVDQRDMDYEDVGDWDIA
ncbi:hypothetical protein F5Y15DRAFT_382653 [Xylariaceae sp. FL0016]|nr:hypothetical protein F5Y15DRAFT_382653 [Xylariaceae sp. FL0016]